MYDVKLMSHLANLSKIAFTDEGIEKMTKQMSDIIDVMDKAKEFEDNDSVYSSGAVKYKELRKDEAKQSLQTESIIQNAKNVKNNSFVVPKVV